MMQIVFDQPSGLWVLPNLKLTTVPHALNHIKERAEYAIKRAKKTVAVQAGGNIGLWPRRYSQVFEHVLTFEPEPATWECLVRNTSGIANITRFNAALGKEKGYAAVNRRSLGSHHISDADDASSCRVTTIDKHAALSHVGLIQLDIEGYEYPALLGAVETVARCHPVIQLEMNDFPGRFPWTHDDTYALLASWGYRRTYKIKADEIFEHA